MTIETEIRARLVADSTVSGLVSARIYPLVLPQSPTYPAITYHRVSGVRLHHLGGVSGRAVPRISFSMWAQTYTGCQALAAAVRQSLDGFNGTLTTIKALIEIENEFDLFEDEASENGVFRIVQDYFCSHLET